ncbi:MAG: DUF962 domain-containing protein [Bacteroidetes bacterium]|nr:DUF962 domain-containing protein [Bacteroidota bacterium]
MKPIQSWFDEYAESHQNHTNKMFHFFCVPLIFFSVIGLLVSIPTNFLNALFQNSHPFIYNFGTLAILLCLIFYLRLSFSLFIGMTIISSLALLGNYYLSTIESIPLWLFSLIIFAFAWAGQFYGHKVEGKKPAFFKDVQFLLIGPAWVLAFLYDKIGLKY